MTNPLDELRVFHGEATTTHARVYAALPNLSPGDGWTLSGVVVGPFRLGSQTLPATVPLRMVAAIGAGIMAEAVIPDPCGWSPDSPMTYRVRIELRRGDETVASCERSIGLRLLGVRGRSLYWEGRRWVLRGVNRASARSNLAAGDDTGGNALSTSIGGASPQDCDAWASNYAVIWAAMPDDALCQRASDIGVPIAVEIENGNAVAAELARCARWPAVVVAVLDAGTPLDRVRVADAPNLLRFAAISRFPIAIPTWAHGVVIDETTLSTASELNVPVIVRRSGKSFATLAQARRECDHLQRDVAPLGDFAGYVV